MTEKKFHQKKSLWAVLHQTIQLGLSCHVQKFTGTQLYIVGGGQFVKQLIMSKECSQGLTMTSLDPEGDTLTEISAHNVLKYNKMVLLVYEWYIFFSRLSLAGLYQRKMEKENFLTLCLVD